MYRHEGVSVSADGSKGVKPPDSRSRSRSSSSFSIRRWIEGCEAGERHRESGAAKVSVSADGSKGVKRYLRQCRLRSE